MHPSHAPVVTVLRSGRVLLAKWPGYNWGRACVTMVRYSSGAMVLSVVSLRSLRASGNLPRFTVAPRARRRVLRAGLRGSARHRASFKRRDLNERSLKSEEQADLLWHSLIVLDALEMGKDKIMQTQKNNILNCCVKSIFS